MNFLIEEAPRLRIAGLAILAGVAFSLLGCISSEETVYNEAPRVKVEFESDKAAHIFYEALSRTSDKRHSESKTELSLPIIFEHKRRVVTGESVAFNNAVGRCDTNKDGRITEQEARIFADHP